MTEENDSFKEKFPSLEGKGWAWDSAEQKLVYSSSEEYLEPEMLSVDDVLECCVDKQRLREAMKRVVEWHEKNNEGMGIGNEAEYFFKNLLEELGL